MEVSMFPNQQQGMQRPQVAQPPQQPRPQQAPGWPNQSGGGAQMPKQPGQGWGQGGQQWGGGQQQRRPGQFNPPQAPPQVNPLAGKFADMMAKMRQGGQLPTQPPAPFPGQTVAQQMPQQPAPMPPIAAQQIARPAVMPQTQPFLPQIAQAMPGSGQTPPTTLDPRTQQFMQQLLAGNAQRGY